MTQEEQVTAEDRDTLADLLEEVGPILDQIVEICGKDPYLHAYIPGNLWASRYGFMGQGVFDTLEEWLQDAGDEADTEQVPQDCKQEVQDTLLGGHGLRQAWNEGR